MSYRQPLQQNDLSQNIEKIKKIRALGVIGFFHGVLGVINNFLVLKIMSHSKKVMSIAPHRDPVSVPYTTKRSPWNRQFSGKRLLGQKTYFARAS